MQPRIARQRSSKQNEDKQNCLNITTVPKKKFTSWRNVSMRSTQKWPLTSCQSSSWRTRRQNWLNKWRLCHKAWRAAATATKHRKDLKIQMEWLRLLQQKNQLADICGWMKKKRKKSFPLIFFSKPSKMAKKVALEAETDVAKEAAKKERKNCLKMVQRIQLFLKKTTG